ncbi:MAG: PVC-type heme-binding CxxCH protein [Planctomycetota bacterium]
MTLRNGFFGIAAVCLCLFSVAAHAADPKVEELRKEQAKLLKHVKIPDEFEAQIFAAPPDISYPVAIAATPTGELFVSQDKNSSLGRDAKKGSIIRCVDTDGDGRADRFDPFVETMDCPRGIAWDDGAIYVINQPDLTVFRDLDGDGRSDESKVLVKGIAFSLKDRPADHTSNGIRIGIDGWLYLAIGDFGFMEAEGADGRKLQLHGGGIVRVRPSGNGLELYARGTRNIYDLALSPRLEGFTRDNTNDGGGWDIRLSQIVSLAEYGYRSLYKNFGDEIFPPLAIYGRGSGCGVLYLQEPGFGEGFGDTLYTADWGRSMVYRHPLKAKGADWVAEQKDFVRIPRPTDLDVDAKSNLYISSWLGGMYRYGGPKVGFIVRMNRKGRPVVSLPDLKTASTADLAATMGSPSHTLRVAAQRELVLRDDAESTEGKLRSIVSDSKDINARVAAIFTLREVLGSAAAATLIDIAKDASVREYAIRALADRADDDVDVPSGPLLRGLDDASARVRVQSLIAVARLGRDEAAKRALELTRDSDPVVAHTAVKALVRLKAIKPCLETLGASAEEAKSGLRVLREIHDPKAVDGLLAALGSASAEIRGEVLTTLLRLYHREAPWDGKSWGTRPDTRGPYYRLETWDASARIGERIAGELRSLPAAQLASLLGEIGRHRVRIDGTVDILLVRAKADASLASVAIDYFAMGGDLSASAIAFLENAANDKTDAVKRKKVLSALAKSGDGRARAIVQRALASGDETLNDLWEGFVRDPRHARRAQDFVRLARAESIGESELGFGVLLGIASAKRAPKRSKRAAEQEIFEAWRVTERKPGLLRAIGRAKARGYDSIVRAHLDDQREDVQSAAKFAADRLGIDKKPKPKGSTLETIAFEKVQKRVAKKKGDLRLGAALFEKMSCVKCHTVSPKEAPKGPFLGGIATRYKRHELVQSILKPAATVAQGFTTQWFQLRDGTIRDGFVVREAGDEVEIRDGQGTSTVISKKKIIQRGKSEGSIMPEGLVNSLSIDEFGALLTYLESLEAAPAPKGTKK